MANVLKFLIVKRQVFLVVLLAGLIQTGAWAQSSRRNGSHQAHLANLSGDERARLQSAHQAAMRDPALRESRAKFQQARKEFRDKLQDALIKADPSVQPIIEKVKRQRPDER
ncbi:MAG: hypothetical protein QOH24_1191 [Verrucomicrobiota bacterium]